VEPSADWHWQLRHAVRDFGSNGALRAGRLPPLVTPYYLGLSDPSDPSCPLRRQVVPSPEEARAVAGDLEDPLGEEAHEVAPDLVRRYPDRALLLVTDRCAVH
jgi:lysine 2,3-aminomutase